MENLSQNIQQPLEFMIYTTIVMFIFISVFLVKLLIDLSNLAKSLQLLTVFFKKEIEPTLKELKYTLSNINSVALNMDGKVNTINSAFNTSFNAVSDSAESLAIKAKVLGSSLKQGLLAGFKVLLENSKKSK